MKGFLNYLNPTTITDGAISVLSKFGSAISSTVASYNGTLPVTPTNLTETVLNTTLSSAGEKIAEETTKVVVDNSSALVVLTPKVAECLDDICQAVADAPAEEKTALIGTAAVGLCTLLGVGIGGKKIYDKVKPAPKKEDGQKPATDAPKADAQPSTPVKKEEEKPADKPAATVDAPVTPVVEQTPALPTFADLLKAQPSAAKFLDQKAQDELKNLDGRVVSLLMSSEELTNVICSKSLNNEVARNKFLAYTVEEQLAVVNLLKKNIEAKKAAATPVPTTAPTTAPQTKPVADKKDAVKQQITHLQQLEAKKQQLKAEKEALEAQKKAKADAAKTDKKQVKPSK